MAMNIMGQYKRPNEQDLVANLIEEAIEQRGVQVRYILRDLLNPDELFGESTMSDFKQGYELPMFVESVEHFNGNGDVFDEFGINKVDSSIFQVGVRKFRLEVTSNKEATEVERPREGDLIYLPFSDSLWEITKVKMDLKYYQMGRNYTYRLVCKLFEYSHEEINNPESDFSTYSTVTDLDDAGLKRLLEVGPGEEIDENGHIQEAFAPYDVQPSTDTFGF
jgi:hypothetical protein